MIAYNGKILKIHHFPGPNYTYEVVSRKTVPFREGNHIPDAVRIVGLWKGTKLLVINEFRPQINDWILDLPAGKLDPEETVEDCAERELKEETGLNIVKITNVFYHAFPSVGMTDEQQAMVFCEVDGKPSEKFLQGHERIKPMLMDIKELRQIEPTQIIGNQLATVIGVLDYILV